MGVNLLVGRTDIGMWISSVVTFANEVLETLETRGHPATEMKIVNVQLYVEAFVSARTDRGTVRLDVNINNNCFHFSDCVVAVSGKGLTFL